MKDIILPTREGLKDQGFVKFFVDSDREYWKKGDNLVAITLEKVSLISHNTAVGVVDSHTKLYVDKVDDFCSHQQQILKYLDIYGKIKRGSLSEDMVNDLYEQMSDDEDGYYYDYEEHGSKTKFLEYESLRLIDCYKKCLTETLEVSMNRLENLLVVLGKENKDV